VRRVNAARCLPARLNRGTRVEIHPLNQSQAGRPRQRTAEYGLTNVRHGDRIVAAWAAGDDQGLDDAWVDVLVDRGSERSQYAYVTDIGCVARPARLPGCPLRPVGLPPARSSAVPRRGPDALV
jgi:hypothetical protein